MPSRTPTRVNLSDMSHRAVSGNVYGDEANASVDAALRWIRGRVPECSPRVGIVLGSGLGPLADSISEPIRLDYADIPGFPVSHVSGHAGKLVLGKLGGLPVVAMQGRSHLYEGNAAYTATLPVRAMIALGIELLIVSNASGGINPRFQSGEIVLIDSHIDLMFRTAILPSEVLHGSSIFGVPHRSRAIYSPDWMRLAQSCAMELGFSLPRGTYLATLGPNYETRAEYRAFARLGADMVGMSTVPETMLAAQLGTPVLAFSIVTNVATPDVPKKTEHTEVLDWTRTAQQRLVPLIEKMLAKMNA